MCMRQLFTGYWGIPVSGMRSMLIGLLVYELAVVKGPR
jgi:hypothetical protein